MILACGEALIDFTPIEINKEVAYVPKEGGSPYNVAITLGRLGTLCGFFGKISKDFFGEMLIEKLRNNHVDTSFVLRSEKSTTLAFVILKEGEPHFVFYGENPPIKASPAPTVSATFTSLPLEKAEKNLV